MDKKLTINTIAVIDLGSENSKFNSLVRVFVKDFNEAERRYTTIVLSSGNGYRSGKLLLIRDKAIVKVDKEFKVLPDLRLWTQADAISFCTYEYNVLSVTAKQQRGDINQNAWELYIQKYTYLIRTTNKDNLDLFLRAREEYFKARLLPFDVKAKSRTVMRRLRQKEAMRSTNSPMSGRRTRATYLSPSQLVSSQKISKDGITTRKKGRKKKKKGKLGEVTQPVAQVARVGLTPSAMAAFVGDDDSQDYYGYSFTTTSSRQSAAKVKAVAKATKAWNKNIETKYPKEDIPF
jgi:hypothetical protein